MPWPPCGRSAAEWHRVPWIYELSPEAEARALSPADVAMHNLKEEETMPGQESSESRLSASD